MQRATILGIACLLLTAGTAAAQKTDFVLPFPPSADYKAPYSLGTRTGGGAHSGARGVNGPFDLDGDGRKEVLVTDYSGGGRVHVVENAGVDTWEIVYSTPWMDSTAATSNTRFATGGDLDKDGRGEIIFVSGAHYSQANIDAGYGFGVYVYEYSGTGNDYGTRPSSINVVDVPGLGLPPRVTGTQVLTAEYLEIADVDGDGFQELLLPLNGPGTYDHFFIYSVSGDFETNGAGTTFESWFLEGRVSPRLDGPTYGGGSPIAFHAADLDGNGDLELSFHSWNNYNFFNADAPTWDLYVYPVPGSTSPHLAATTVDHVSLFGGVAVDINGDGDEEVYYPRFQSTNSAVSVLNYEQGEDILQVTPDQFKVDVVTGLSNLGLTAGDLDRDGKMELIGSGLSYTAEMRNSNTIPAFVRVAEFTGDRNADPEDPANYTVEELAIFSPWDTLTTNFNLILRDSAGVQSQYYENTAFQGDRGGARIGQGPDFVSKLAYLGDVDGDGANEVAIALQGIDDSTFVIREVFNPADTSYTRTLVESRAVENRAFVRIISGPGSGVATEDRVVLPGDYKLSANYPNPFNPTTAFSFTLPIDKAVSVKVYDVTGRVVKTLVENRTLNRGTHEVTWDGTNDAGAAVASGTYLYSLEYGAFRQSRTMTLVK